MKLVKVHQAKAAFDAELAAQAVIKMEDAKREGRFADGLLWRHEALFRQGRAQYWFRLAADMMRDEVRKLSYWSWIAEG